MLFICASVTSAAKAVPVIVKFKATTQTIQEGDPFNAAEGVYVSKKVTVLYSSSHPQIASITSKGLVVGKKEGSVTLTVSVSQKGYSGRATMVLNVTAKQQPKELTAEELKAVVKAGITQLYKKNKDTYTATEQTTLQALLKLDRTKMIDALIVISAEAKPTWSPAMVKDFAVKHLEADLPSLFDLLSIANRKADYYIIFDIVSAFTSEKAVTLFGNQLKTNPNKDIRYTLAYHLSKIPTDQAMGYLAAAMPTESEESVYGNMLAASLTLAGADQARIEILFESYPQLSAEHKSSFQQMLTWYQDDATWKLIHDTWVIYLKEKVQGTNEQERSAANEILDVINK
jgi:hypothetical protein